MGDGDDFSKKDGKWVCNLPQRSCMTKKWGWEENTAEINSQRSEARACRSAANGVGGKTLAELNSQHSEARACRSAAVSGLVAGETAQYLFSAATNRV